MASTRLGGAVGMVAALAISAIGTAAFGQEDRGDARPRMNQNDRPGGDRPEARRQAPDRMNDDRRGPEDRNQGPRARRGDGPGDGKGHRGQVNRKQVKRWLKNHPEARQRMMREFGPPQGNRGGRAGPDGGRRQPGRGPAGRGQGMNGGGGPFGPMQPGPRGDRRGPEQRQDGNPSQGPRGGMDRDRNRGSDNPFQGPRGGADRGPDRQGGPDQSPRGGDDRRPRDRD